MRPDRGTAAPGTRGRVVMLVDNGVAGDSRVQKAARSAADAGWEVILLGALGESGDQSWRIGDAEVRLVRVAQRLKHPVLLRRSILRRPLAYPPGWASYRVHSVRAWRVDLDARQVAIALARRHAGGRWRDVAGQSRLVVARIAAKVVGRWVKFRAGELSRLRRNQQNPASLLTKISISLWRTTKGDRSWRKLDPGLWEYEFAFGPVIDELAPHLIHAHDFRMVGVGVRAARRARAMGRQVKLVWDAHEFVPGTMGRDTNVRWLPAQIAYVNEYAPQADAVITVSSTLADLLQRTHGLPERPAVMLNAPVSSPAMLQHDVPLPDLRTLCGVGPDTPLLAYCGGINPVRGVDLMIDALPSLPGVHVALVTLHPNGRTTAADELRARAAELGVADRLHVLPYVPHWQVAPFLATADAGVVPFHHLPNYELALITKFLEYAHARLPMVVSDLRTMAETTRTIGQGEVFRAQDLDDYLRAVKAVLVDPQRYRAAYDRPGLLEQWTWEAQAQVLDDVYSRLLPDRPPLDGADDELPGVRPGGQPHVPVSAPA